MKKFLTLSLITILVGLAGAQAASAQFGYGGNGQGQGPDHRNYPDLPPTANPHAVVNTQKGRAADVIHIFLSNLFEGVTSPEVTELQDRLRFEGYFNYVSTGYYGPITTQAVKDYQTAHGLPVTGDLDDATRAELNA